MTGIDWVLLVGKVIVVFFALLISVLLYIWMERKVIADFQTRTGPMRAGPRGVLVTLADGVKLFFKESITPTNADRAVYVLAPIIAMVPAFLAFSVIPFGAPVTIFGRTVPLQLADLNIGVLWVLAMTSIGVYAIVLAGWSSGSNYPLLGAIRSTAQMISYEVAMGLALVAVLMFSGHLRMSEIVDQQGTVWNVIPQFPAFVIFLICALAEVNRPPFDLAEAETELVAGFHTEYSGIKFALFYLGEYVNTVTISAIAATTTVFTYSPSMKNANRIPEYSVWNPATSSDSASARSNGGRFVSASAQMRKITNAGNCGSTYQIVVCASTIALIRTCPLNISTAMIARLIATS